MSPKEKARQLYDYFYAVVHDYHAEDRTTVNTAKDCALFVVSELMFHCSGPLGAWYWDMVKQEINKL
jgi:hypothetical protein